MRRQNYSIKPNKIRRTKHTKKKSRQIGGADSTVIVYINPLTVKALLNKDDVTILQVLISKDQKIGYIRKEIHIDNPVDNFQKCISLYQNILRQLCCHSYSISKLDILENRDEDLANIWSFMEIDKAENKTDLLPKQITSYDDLIKFMKYMRELFINPEIKKTRKFGFGIKKLPDNLQNFISGSLRDAVYNALDCIPPNIQANATPNLQSLSSYQPPNLSQPQSAQLGQQLVKKTISQQEKKLNKTAILTLVALGFVTAPAALLALPFLISLFKKGMKLYGKTLETLKDPTQLNNFKNILASEYENLPDSIKKRIPDDIKTHINKITKTTDNTETKEKIEKINEILNNSENSEKPIKDIIIENQLGTIESDKINLDDIVNTTFTQEPIESKEANIETEGTTASETAAETATTETATPETATTETATPETAAETAAETATTETATPETATTETAAETATPETATPETAAETATHETATPETEAVSTETAAETVATPAAETAATETVATPAATPAAEKVTTPAATPAATPAVTESSSSSTGSGDAPAKLGSSLKNAASKVASGVKNIALGVKSLFNRKHPQNGGNRKFKLHKTPTKKKYYTKKLNTNKTNNKYPSTTLNTRTVKLIKNHKK